MATLPIHLEVEDTAVGPVLILLKRTPGIIKMNLMLDTGPAPIAPRIAGVSIEQTVLAMLLKSDEPVHVSELQSHLGGAKSRVYGALNGLKKKGVVKNVAKATWALTDKARRELGGQKLLPPPSPSKPNAKTNGHHVDHDKRSYRARKGIATSILLKALAEKPLRPIDIKAALDAGGASGKGLSGVMDRARRDGLAKKNSEGLYELTPKGVKEAAATQQGE